MKNSDNTESQKTVEVLKIILSFKKESLTPQALRWANEFLDVDEYELALETIVDDLIEHDWSISKEEYKIFEKAARRLSMEDILTKVHVDS